MNYLIIYTGIYNICTIDILSWEEFIKNEISIVNNVDLYYSVIEEYHSFMYIFNISARYRLDPKLIDLLLPIYTNAICAFQRINDANYIKYHDILKKQRYLSYDKISPSVASEYFSEAELNRYVSTQRSRIDVEFIRKHSKCLYQHTLEQLSNGECDVGKLCIEIIADRYHSNYDE